MIRRTVFLSLCAVFLSAPACAQPPQVCTQMGCLNGLTIRVTPEMSWPTGQYVLQFLVNNKTKVECKGMLPLKKCEKGASFTCDVPGVTIGESGCALPANQHGLSDIHIAAIPTKLSLNIFHDGTMIHSRTYEPEYKTFRPNGPNCDPECTGGSVSLYELPQGE
jgi:hypothetical protein